MALPDHDEARRERLQRPFGRLADGPIPPDAIISDQEIIDEVRACEEKYGMTADEAAKLIRRGELEETHEICNWLMSDKIFKRINDRSKE